MQVTHINTTSDEFRWNLTSISHNTTTDLRTSDVVLSSVCLVLVTLSNAIVVHLAFKNWHKKRYRNIPNVLVISLAITDGTTGLVGYLLRLIPYITSNPVIHGTEWCSVSIFIFSILLTFSQYIVVLMGCERFASLRKPYFYRRHCTRFLCFVIIGCVFVYCILFSSFQLYSINQNYLYRTADLNPDNLHCFPKQTTNGTSGPHSVYHWFELVQGLGLLVIMLYCNLAVVATLRTMEQQAALFCPKNRTEYLRQMDMISGRHRDFSRLIIAISVSFTICVLPVQVRIFCNQLRLWKSGVADFVAWRLSLSNALVNPLLYGLLTRDLRRRICAWCALKRHCCHTNSVSPMNLTNDTVMEYTPSDTSRF